MKVRARKYLSLTCLVGMTTWSYAAMAQVEKLQLDLRKCAVITDINTRVACYDELAQSQESKPLTVRAQPEKKPVAPAVAKIETFGQPTAKLVPVEGKDAVALLDKVSSIKELRSDKLQITLANGQVWQQTVGKTFFIRVGDTVRIAHSGWGRSFRLAVDGHADYIQVSRLN
jgi:hypothetical protein